MNCCSSLSKCSVSKVTYARLFCSTNEEQNLTNTIFYKRRVCLYWRRNAESCVIALGSGVGLVVCLRYGRRLIRVRLWDELFKPRAAFNSRKYLKIRFEFCEWESAKIFFRKFRTFGTNKIKRFYQYILFCKRSVSGDIMEADPSRNAHTCPPIKR